MNEKRKLLFVALGLAIFALAWAGTQYFVLSKKQAEAPPPPAVVVEEPQKPEPAKVEPSKGAKKKVAKKATKPVKKNKPLKHPVPKPEEPGVVCNDWGRCCDPTGWCYYHMDQW